MFLSWSSSGVRSITLLSLKGEKIRQMRVIERYSLFPLQPSLFFFLSSQSSFPHFIQSLFSVMSDPFRSTSLPRLNESDNNTTTLMNPAYSGSVTDGVRIYIVNFFSQLNLSLFRILLLVQKG